MEVGPSSPPLPPPPPPPPPPCPNFHIFNSNFGLRSLLPFQASIIPLPPSPARPPVPPPHPFYEFFHHTAGTISVWTKRDTRVHSDNINTNNSSVRRQQQQRQHQQQQITTPRKRETTDLLLTDKTNTHYCTVYALRSCSLLALKAARSSLSPWIQATVPGPNVIVNIRRGQATKRRHPVPVLRDPRGPVDVFRKRDLFFGSVLYCSSSSSSAGAGANAGCSCCRKPRRSRGGCTTTADAIATFPLVCPRSRHPRRRRRYRRRRRHRLVEANPDRFVCRGPYPTALVPLRS